MLFIPARKLLEEGSSTTALGKSFYVPRVEKAPLAIAFFIKEKAKFKILLGILM